VIVSVQTWFIRSDLIRHGIQNLVSWVGMIVVIASAFALAIGLRNRQEMRAFVGSNFLIVGLLATGAATIFPVMLYSTLAPENSLTAYTVASNQSSLVIAAIWWPVAFILAASYFVIISRQYTGKVSVRRDTQGYY
jgi:cytochrome bd-type quinol oxidase subunit 2